MGEIRSDVVVGGGRHRASVGLGSDPRVEALAIQDYRKNPSPLWRGSTPMVLQSGNDRSASCRGTRLMVSIPVATMIKTNARSVVSRPFRIRRAPTSLSPDHCWPCCQLSICLTGERVDEIGTCSMPVVRESGLLETKEPSLPSLPTCSEIGTSPKAGNVVGCASLSRGTGVSPLSEKGAILQATNSRGVAVRCTSTDPSIAL